MSSLFCTTNHLRVPQLSHPLAGCHCRLRLRVLWAGFHYLLQFLPLQLHQCLPCLQLLEGVECPSAPKSPHSGLCSSLGRAVSVGDKCQQCLCTIWTVIHSIVKRNTVPRHHHQKKIYMTLCQKVILKSGQFSKITYPRRITLEENLLWLWLKTTISVKD